MADDATLTIRFRDETLSGGSKGGGTAPRGDGGAAATPGANVADDFQRSIGGGAGQRSRPGNAARTWSLGESKGDWSLDPDPQPMPDEDAKSMPADGSTPTAKPARRIMDIVGLASGGEGSPPPSPAAATVGDAAGLAGQAAQAMGGQVGAALARTAQAAAAIPGVGTMAIPGVTAAALGTAGLVGGAIAAGVAIPAAAAGVLLNESERARGQIQGLSADVAQAEANARVRQIMANLRTAGILGDEVAANIEQRSRIGAATQNIRDVLSESGLRELNRHLTVIAAGLEGFSNLMQTPAGRMAADQFTQRLIDAFMQPFGGPVLRQLMTIAEWLGVLNGKTPDANNPLLYWMNQPMPDLPAPFTDTGDAPLDAQFVPIAGLAIN